jgi:hypothetical protein
LLGGLPAELRPRLEPVLGVRALLPVVRVSGSSVAGRLLDAEGKTVLRLVYERPAAIAGSRARLPGGLRLVPLRGYATAAVRRPGSCRAPGWSATTAATTRPRWPRPASIRSAPIRRLLRPELPADARGGEGAAVLPRRDGRRRDGTIDDVDIEFLHDFRVAVRRSRSVVRLLGDLLPADLVAWVTPELKWLGDLTAAPATSTSTCRSSRRWPPA